jgi:hypothetical protein
MTTHTTIALKDKQKFYSELNIQMAIPFKSQSTLSGESKDTTVCVSDDDVSKVLKIKTANSSSEALTPLAYDVLNCLLDFAKQQMKSDIEMGRDINVHNFQVFFSYRQICEKLKLNPSNSQGNIAKAIRSLRKIELRVIGHAFNLKLSDYQYVDKEFNLVKDLEKSLITNSGGSAVKRSVTLDPFVVGLMSSDFSVNREKYLQLTQGKERRAFMFIQAKKKVLGNIFSFKMSELVDVLGDSDKRKDNQKRSITKVLKALEEKTEGFSYHIKAVYGTGEKEILVEFDDDVSEDDKTFETKFYGDLAYYYGLRNLEKIDFFEADYIDIQDKLSEDFFEINQSYTLKYRNQTIRYSDLVVDLALFQIIKAGYDKIGYRKLINIVSSHYLRNETFQLPDRYGKFVSEKVQALKKKEKQEKIREEMAKREEREKEEVESKEQAFEDVYENYFLNKKELISHYRKIAEEQVDKENEGISPDMYKLMRNMYVEDRIKLLARNDFYNPDKSQFTKYFESGAKELSYTDILQIEQ